MNVKVEMSKKEAKKEAKDLGFRESCEMTPVTAPAAKHCHPVTP